MPVSLLGGGRVARRILGTLSAAAGLGLFALAVRRAGAEEVVRNVYALGWGFAVVLGLSGVRLFVRALAWIQCIEHESHELRPSTAFRAILVGEALGNVTPLGLVISEPAKAAFVRAAIPVGAGLSALAVEDIFYSLSVAVVIGLGMGTLLLSFAVPVALKAASLMALTSVAAVLGGAALVIGGHLKPASAILSVLLPQRPERRAWIERVARIEEDIYGFSRRNLRRLPIVVLFESIFHVAGVAEAYVVLRWLGVSTTLLTAFVLESVNRVINVLFKFIPLRLGVDEAGTGLLTHVLGLGASPGVALAIARKARVLVWCAVGIGLLVQRGLTQRTAPKGR